jgi:hypothetical protein
LLHICAFAGPGLLLSSRTLLQVDIGRFSADAFLNGLQQHILGRLLCELVAVCCKILLDFAKL